MERSRRSARGVEGISLVSVFACLVLAGVIIVVLFPMFARVRRINVASPCQSNLKQIGNAVKMYLADWGDHYPTNRAYVHGRTLGPVTEYVELSQQEPLPGKTEPPEFQHGLNWVEGLCSYVESITKSDDPASAWRCPAASGGRYPEGSKTAATSYVLNRCLVEKPESIITSAANLLLIREMDRLANAELRPINDSTWTSRRPPVSPFLNSFDRRIGWTNAVLHANGSTILFADGHVKMFSVDYFPAQRDITRANCWDPKTRQWYNYFFADPKTPEQKCRNMSIAITP
jgi:prepilin-type processing-associated H-X9-DG protein